MKNKETKLIKFNGKNFKIPQGGTLGLLALGNIGIRAWKEAKEKYLKENIEERNEEK